MTVTDDLQVDLAKKRTAYITMGNITVSVLYKNLHIIYCSQGTKLSDGANSGRFENRSRNLLH